MEPLRKVLIANRGEIALRVKRTCDRLGIATVFVFSEGDRHASWVKKGDEAVCIGPAPAKDSYLNGARIIDVALERGCDAIHPGYGFLSESAPFVRAVESAGLRFIGPPSPVVAAFGDKREARRRVEAYGVPCVPGVHDAKSDDELMERAAKLPFPLILKAAAGGGGRGMRIVHSVSELRDALPLARGEAQKFFGDPAIFAERYIENPRHVEVQIVGCTHGKIVHFGTRDCSTQRRHQKLIEEAPAPFLSTSLRERIHEVALAAGRSVGYVNAGTVELLVSGDDIFFLEVNTRIQVEHPVTEVVTKTDLIEMQLRVAQGEPLPVEQSDISFTGHAIEFRVYAEDPRRNFAPVLGELKGIRRYEAPFVREDSGFEVGDNVTPFYDAMLSKIIVWGPTRERAIARSLHALLGSRVEGLETTIGFHEQVLRDPRFAREGIDIGYVERELLSRYMAQS